MGEVRLKIDMKKAYKKLSQENLSRGRYAAANQAMADMSPFVPFKEGDLRQKVSANERAIVYHSKYAKRQFYRVARNYSTPGTGRRWDLKAKSTFKGSLKKAFKRGAGL